jgi:hypothetical protein
MIMDTKFWVGLVEIVPGRNGRFEVNIFDGLIFGAALPRLVCTVQGDTCSMEVKPCLCTQPVLEVRSGICKVHVSSSDLL